MQCTAEPN